MSARAQNCGDAGISTIPAADLIRLLSCSIELRVSARTSTHSHLRPIVVAASEPSSPTKPKKGRKAGRSEHSSF